MLKCPRTGQPMVEVEIHGIVVDVSTGCGGVWFDNFELRKFDEAHEQAGQELTRLMEQYRKPVLQLEKRLRCPRDPDVTMMRRFFSPQRKVSLDECPACGGVWLDPGELSEIHRLYPSEAQRQEAGRRFAQELAQSSGLDAAAAESQERAARARRFAGMFKWVCPSAYIPGDQEWGAF